MKKIFILTGETSGDKLASEVISNLPLLLNFIPSGRPEVFAITFARPP